jgi:uncharacterized protein involved in exopolysaccharide biosynthesis
MKNNEEVFQTTTNFKAIIYKILDYKKYFVFSVILFLFIAFLFNKFSPNTYKNQTSILINQEKENPLLSSENLLKGINALGGNTNNIENEVGALKSFNLINQTLTSLGLEISYFAEENAFFSRTKQGSKLNVSRELYKDAPFQVLIDKSQAQPLYLKFYITFLPGEKFRIQAEGKEVLLC